MSGSLSAAEVCVGLELQPPVGRVLRVDVQPQRVRVACSSTARKGSLSWSKTLTFRRREGALQLGQGQGLGRGGESGGPSHPMWQVLRGGVRVQCSCQHSSSSPEEGAQRGRHSAAGAGADRFEQPPACRP